MREKIKILGVSFDRTTEKEALEKIKKWLSPGLHLFKKHVIVTPNPEILLTAQKDNKYRRILNKADLSIPDGIGILWASKFNDIANRKDSKLKKFSKWFISLSLIPLSRSYTRSVLPERITGVDLMKKICKIASQNTEIKGAGSRVFLLGAEDGVAEKTAEKLIKTYPNLQIVGTYAGTPKQKHERKILELINIVKPDILFVAYGAPEQEKWIARNYRMIPSIRIAMGVGGAFDFISGVRKRAPVIMQKTGLEWLFRLCKQPSRIKRIVNATILFPIKVLKNL